MRSGFTLVETLVALVLLELGMLALAAGIAGTARDLAYVRHATAAHARARNRVAQLRADPCVAAASGSVHEAAWAEHWRVEAEGSTRRIVDSIVFTRTGGKTGVVVARAITWCAT